jgi:hypothetical protein
MHATWFGLTLPQGSIASTFFAKKKPYVRLLGEADKNLDNEGLLRLKIIKHANVQKNKGWQLKYKYPLNSRTKKRVERFFSWH